MYATGTILELKEQRPDEEIPARKDPDTGRTRPKQKLPFLTILILGVSTLPRA